MSPEEKNFISELPSQEGETEWLEFKENNSDQDQIGEYISSQSNSASLHQRDEAYLIISSPISKKYEHILTKHAFSYLTVI